MWMITKDLATPEFDQEAGFTHVGNKSYDWVDGIQDELFKFRIGDADDNILIEGVSDIDCDPEPFDYLENDLDITFIEYLDGENWERL